MEGLHPDQVFDFPIPGDPGEDMTGIVLHFKHRSVAYWMAYSHALDTFDLSGESSNDAHMLKLITEAAIGWTGLVDLEDGRDLPYDGDPGTLAKGITATQLAGLVYGLPAQCQLTDIERKKSKSPSPLSPVNSATDAEPGGVSTNQANNKPSNSIVQLAEGEGVTVAGGSGVGA